MNNHARDNAYSHCKACDTRFYPRWIDETKPCGTRVQMFEELCNTCLNIATQAARADKDLYRTDQWVEDHKYMEDRRFMEGYLMDKPKSEQPDFDTPNYNDPTYYETGGGFGDIGLFDSYEQ